MNKHWLNKKQNNECILFFNGWGMDNNAIKNMQFGDMDVCIFSNYGNFSTFDIAGFGYKKIHLIAWSLGVSMAHKILANNNISISTSIAINGTPYPMHNEFGISQPTFEKTLSNWDERNRKKFNIRMMGGMSNYKSAEELLSQRSLKDQQTELQFFYDNNAQLGHEKANWDFAIIGENDLIIPTQNQLNYWNGKTNIIANNGAHFPFNEMGSWQELLEICAVK